MLSYLMNDVSYGSILLMAIRDTTSGGRLISSDLYQEQFTLLGVGETEDCPLYPGKIVCFTKYNTKRFNCKIYSSFYQIQSKKFLSLNLKTKL